MNFPEAQGIGGGEDLEQRLRGLLLKNDRLPAPTGFAIPSHPAAASTNKRPNQAQRRQLNSHMAAEMAVQTNPRAANESPRSQGYQSSPGHFQQPQASFAQGGHRQNAFPAGRHGQQQRPTPFLVGSARPPQGHVPAPSSGSWRPNRSDSQSGNGGPILQSSPGNPHQANSPHVYGPGQFAPRPAPQNRQLYQPNSRQGQGGHHSRPSGPQYGSSVGEISRQSALLDQLVTERVDMVGIEPWEIAEKENFRIAIEMACREAIVSFERDELENPNFLPGTVELKCFGSMASGFATRASDMDLALLSPYSNPSPELSESPLPRLVEKKLLELGYGARLLTRTRVPIIKLCQKPTEKLMAGLLEARAKWEAGFSETDSQDATNEEETDEKTTDDVQEDIGTETGGQSFLLHPLYPQRLASLKQKADQHLNDYYGTARRLMKKIAGRELNLGMAQNIEEDEWQLSNDICKAFVAGLADESSRSRLQQYSSLSFDPAIDSAGARSLVGVHVQVEAEQLMMAWEEKLRRYPLGEYSGEVDRYFSAWQDLANTVDIPTMGYNKLLYLEFDKMKRIPALQLVRTEQMSNEDLTQYYGKFTKLLTDLRVRDLQPGSLQDEDRPIDPMLQAVMSQYIAGIRNTRVRDQMMRFISDNWFSLKDLSQIHRVLQLADDYEGALSADFYGPGDREDVRQYVELLRSCQFIPSGYAGQPAIGVAFPSYSDSAVESVANRIRDLPNPSKAHKGRDKYYDPLEFPKDEVGIQCDINFSAALALHNTALLRCYSHCDPRVQPMVLFVKHWAKVRGINTPYRGTLSSYGYVLMVLHYLVNVAVPFVCPNLQQLRREPPSYIPPSEAAALETCKGHDVHFWRNEAEIRHLASQGMLTQNHETVGMLLRGFFEYYAQSGTMSNNSIRGFDWGREVLSLRTLGGILSKQEKGWVGAKTVVETTSIAAPPPKALNTTSPIDTHTHPSNSSAPSGADPKSPSKKTLKVVEETKEVRHRYLFAIEDPFETDHNVARTVTHNGIVSIRDEFRRAWRILKSAGKGYTSDEGGLLDDLAATAKPTKSPFEDLMELIHGPRAASQ